MGLLLLFGGVPTTQTIPVDDLNLYWSRTWVGNGGGAMQANNIEAGSTVAATGNTGGYVKGQVDVASTGYLAVTFDTSGLVGASAPDCPTVYYNVDGGPFASQLLVASGSPFTLELDPSLGAGVHTFELHFKSVGGPGIIGARWVLGSAPVYEVRVTGVVIDADAVLEMPEIQPGQLLCYGDSIGEGDNVLLANNDVANDVKNASNDATQALPTLAARAFSCELTQMTYGGVGLSIKGTGNVAASATHPSLYHATDANQFWNKRASGVARSFTSPSPYDLILIEIGANDGASFSQAAVTAFLDDLVAATSAPTEIFWVWYPLADATLKTKVEDGIADVADPTRVHFIDVAALFTAGVPSLYSGDAAYTGSHPNVRGQAHYAAMAIAGIQAVLSAGTGVGGMSRARVVNAAA